jgi:anti-sigma regulatory factor (Ser/Thr protein kinase)
MKELTLEATLENIPVVAAFLDGQMEAAGCTPKARMQMDLAVDELFGNIAHYAYGEETGEATVRFECDEEARMVSVSFMDHGKPFDPLKKKDPDVTLSAEERAIGGLGIFLVKKTMDDMEYRYEQGMNILTIRKKF